MSHRLLYLDDYTRQDVDRMPSKSVPEERDRSVEYTSTYEPNNEWSILTGFKGESDFRANKGSDWVNRELYFKVERHF